MRGSPGRWRGAAARRPPRWSRSSRTRTGAGTPVVIGEYERAFYGSQYAAMAPLLEHYGVQLWMPKAGGGRVDSQSEHGREDDDRARPVIQTGDHPDQHPCPHRDGGPDPRAGPGAPGQAVRRTGTGSLTRGRTSPNKAHAAWGRRAHKLDPSPATAHVVRWIFAQRLTGHSVARIAPRLGRGRGAVPVRGRPRPRNTHRTAAGWTLGTVTTILSNPRYTGRQVWNRQRTDTELADPGNVTLGHRACSGGTCPAGG